MIHLATLPNSNVITTALASANRAAKRGVAHRFNGRLYAVTAPTGTGSPTQFFMALHGLLRPALRRFREGQPSIALELAGERGQVRFMLWIPLGQEPFIEDLLRAAYPGVELMPVEDDPTEFDEAQPFAVAGVGLAHHTLFPIQTEFESESLASLVATLARPRDNERIHLSLLIRPRPNGWRAAARAKANRPRAGRRSLLSEAITGRRQRPTASHHELEQAKWVEEKASYLGFSCSLRVLALGHDEVRSREFLRAVAASLRVFASANSFAMRRIWRRARFVRVMRTRRFVPAGSFLLNSVELAAVWHLPDEALPHVETTRSPKVPPPPSIAKTGRVLGVATDRGDERRVALDVESAMMHCAILGSTGGGKTTLVAGLALQDIHAGRCVMAISGKPDLLDEILVRIPRSRIGDVVYISPHELASSIGLNPLEYRAGDDLELLRNNIVTVFRHLYEANWGPRTSQLFNACIKTLLVRSDSTLDQIPPLLYDGVFRRKILAEFGELPPVLANYWRWYEQLSIGQRTEITSPLMNKLDGLLLHDRVRRIICQRRSTIDLQKIIEERKIVLANLATGVWGDETSSLVGSLLVAKIWQVRRRTGTQKQPTDVFLYIDEAQQFVNISDDFADVLAQARSYRLALTISNQHLGQLPKALRDAISSNARSRVVFQCGQEDARYIAREFAPIEAEHLMSLPRFHVAARLAAAGETSRAFTFRTLPLPSVADPTVASAIEASSRAKFARPNSEIDAEARRAVTPDAAEAPEHGVGRKPRTP